MRDVPPAPTGPEVARVWTKDQLSAQFDACTDRSIIIDLTRRGLAPFEAARQITGHWGGSAEALLDDLPPVILPDEQGVTADHIGSWIDFELFGDPARILADRVAEAVATRDVDRALVLLPAKLRDLPRPDALVLARLAQGLLTRGRAVVLAYPKVPYALPQELGLGSDDALSDEGAQDAPEFPPGPVNPALSGKAQILGAPPMPEAVVAPNGWSYLPPVDRFTQAPPPPDTLSFYAAGWGWEGLPYLIETAEAGPLARYAWKALAARDFDLAEDLARRAATRPGDRDFAASALATILIIGQSFEDLAQLPGQGGDLNRAWGKALAGDATQAAAAFAQSENTAPTAIGLYLRNISALADFRTGNADLAWSKQFSIRDALDAMPDPSAHLRFINCLNMGRLARAKKDFGQATAFITQAFSVRGAHLSEHDLLYREVLLADVATTPAAVKSHWQAARDIFKDQAHPGAIPMRSFRKIVSRPPAPFEFREHAVAEALAGASE